MLDRWFKAAPDPDRVMERRRIHTVAFGDPHDALIAVKTLKAAGFHIEDVHSPFPVHGLEKALGWRETRLPYATLIGGIVGLGLAFLLQVWTHVVDWPLNIGGKTNLALPALVPVAFELTILLAAFATVGTLFVRRGLYPRFDGNANNQPSPLVTDHHFVVAIVEDDASFSESAFDDLCKQLGALDVQKSWRITQ